MLEAKKYRQYAKDCVRTAASMSGKDQQTLLDARAVEAESKGPKSDGGRDPSAPSVVPDACHNNAGGRAGLSGRRIEPPR